MNIPDIQDGGPVGSHDVNAPGVLLVAFHFPPDGSSTGRLRTLGFARHLPRYGWRPVVLAPRGMAYERIDAQSLVDVPAEIPVTRTVAFDARRHFGWRGKYLSLSAIPDRWISWWPTAVVAGLNLIRAHDIRVIWSTYPIGTTHLVAATLARITGLPWVADFRDPMVPGGTVLQQKAIRLVERAVIGQALRLVFTTPGACARYGERHPDLARAQRLCVVANGYEESVLGGLDTDRGGSRPVATPLHLVHSGVLYREGRNPKAFLEAIAALKCRGSLGPEKLRVTLRASGHEELYQEYIDTLGVADIVTLAPSVGYAEAVREQSEADALLLFQGPEFSTQIPAKVFDYLRIGRPILAMTEATGDTARLLEQTGGAVLVSIADAAAIAATLEHFIVDVERGGTPKVDHKVLAGYSRESCTQALAQILADVTREQA